jgi:hypothetical protein
MERALDLVTQVLSHAQRCSPMAATIRQADDLALSIAIEQELLAEPHDPGKVIFLDFVGVKDSVPLIEYHGSSEHP